MTFTHDPLFGCELADGRQDRDGYVYHGTSRAHIVAWEREHGAVPDGMQLDHGCRRRRCCALIHLEPVTPSENGKRKSLAYRLKRKTCRFGHVLDGNRAVTPEGGVCCRSCVRGES